MAERRPGGKRRNGKDPMRWLGLRWGRDPRTIIVWVVAMIIAYVLAG